VEEKENENEFPSLTNCSSYKTEEQINQCTLPIDNKTTIFAKTNNIDTNDQNFDGIKSDAIDDDHEQKISEKLAFRNEANNKEISGVNYSSHEHNIKNDKSTIVEATSNYELYSEEINEETSSFKNETKKKTTIVIPSGNKLGLLVGKISEKKGVVVLKIFPDCPFSNQIAPGDRLCAIDGKDIASLSLTEIGAMLCSQSNKSLTLVFLSDMSIAEKKSTSFVRDDSKEKNPFSDASIKTIMHDNILTNLPTTRHAFFKEKKPSTNQIRGNEQLLPREDDDSTVLKALPNVTSMLELSYNISATSDKTPKFDNRKKNKMNKPIYILDEGIASVDSERFWRGYT